MQNTVADGLEALAKGLRNGSIDLINIDIRQEFLETEAPGDVVTRTPSGKFKVELQYRMKEMPHG